MKPQYKYKLVKLFKPHCSICGEQLQGDGSIVFSYTCSCGEWRWERKDIGSEFELELKKKNEPTKTL